MKHYKLDRVGISIKCPDSSMHGGFIRGGSHLIMLLMATIPRGCKDHVETTVISRRSNALYYDNMMKFRSYPFGSFKSY